MKVRAAILLTAAALLAACAGDDGGETRVGVVDGDVGKVAVSTPGDAGEALPAVSVALSIAHTSCGAGCDAGAAIRANTTRIGTDGEVTPPVDGTGSIYAGECTGEVEPLVPPASNARAGQGTREDSLTSCRADCPATSRVETPAATARTDVMGVCPGRGFVGSGVAPGRVAADRGLSSAREA